MADTELSRAQADCLDAIRLLNTARAETAEQLRVADDLLASAVQSARDWGLTWSEIGTALGVTRSAAQKRFGRRPRTNHPPAS